MTSSLDARYGRSQGSRSRRRVIAIVAGAAGVAVVGAWVIWVGLLSPAATVDVDTTGYSHAQNAIDVSYQLNVEPGTAVVCAVEALDEKFGVVGWKLVELPASTERIRHLEARVRITQPATTGLIHSCWTA
jgi:hypothetical protein